MWLVAGSPDLRGAVDGVNAKFTPSTAIRPDAIVYLNGLARVPGSTTSNGYVWDGQVVTFEEPPVPGDLVAIWQSDVGAIQGLLLQGPSPLAGIVDNLYPTLNSSTLTPDPGSVVLPAQGALARPF